MNAGQMQEKWTIKTFDKLTIYQLYDILQLRTEVFVVEQDCPYQECDGIDKEAYHLFLYKYDNLIAYLRFYFKGENVSIGRVVTSSMVRGKGYGKKLISKVLDRLESDFEFDRIEMSAQTYLIKFYEDFGFYTEGEEYIEDGIQHIKMIK